MEIGIRRMEYGDLEQVAALEQVIFSEPWSKKDFEQELSEPEHRYLVASGEDGTICGYCGYWGVAGEGQIYNVAVREEIRGRGIGKRMLLELLREGEAQGLTAFTLEVRAGNEPAIRLYHGLGFADAGIRRNFYSKPQEDALIMWCHMARSV